MSTSREDSEMPPPSRIPASAKGKGKATSQDSSDPLGSKRKRLACEVCRIRRVRCEWKETGTCLACETGNFQCTGEPTRKKRLKKGEVRPDDSMLELEAQFKAFDIGGAMTFQFIERVFKHCPPNVVGLPTDFYKQYTRSSAGVSKEREIAAEVLCGAFVAAASTFTDHAKIVGKGSPDMPTIRPAGCSFNYSAYIPYGTSRAQPVLSLTYQSRTIFEDSAMRHRPSPEAIYCLIVMDWMTFLTREGGRGRGDRDFVEVLCRSYRTLMMGRRGEIEEKDLERLQGPVNAHLLLLDARSAAVMNVKATFRDIDLGPVFPLLSSQASLTPSIDLSKLRLDHDCCQELGLELLPMIWATAMLFRNFLQIAPARTENVTLLQPLWSQIDVASAYLSDLTFRLTTLPSLLSAVDSAQVLSDLDHLIQTQQSYLAQLDLLIHQKIVQAFVLASSASTPPTPSLLDNYAISRARVQRTVLLLAGSAKKAIDTCSLNMASEVVEMLSVCSAWTSLAKEEKAEVKRELIRELGISLEIGQIFEQCLALAAWSSPAAATQREGLLGALTASYGVLPSNDLPPPPTTLPPPPPPRPISLNPRPIIPFLMKDEDFKLDLSFLDDFARENGIPIDHSLDDEPSSSTSSAGRPSQPRSLPPPNVGSNIHSAITPSTNTITSSSAPPVLQPLAGQLPTADPFDISMFTDPIASFPPLFPFLDQSSLTADPTTEAGRPLE
ncbi:hypothetical protein JCM5353_003753, partial [Sporobolomyces roseus]